MTTKSDTSDEEETDTEAEQTIEEKVREHIERRREAYVNMGTVDSDPEDA